jgi:hypothetical protein
MLLFIIALAGMFMAKPLKGGLLSDTVRPLR